jgi:hypothetical protein
LTHYAGCHNDVESPIDKDNHGVFFLNSSIRPLDVSDGVSHTLFIGEKVMDPQTDLGWMSGTRATLRNTGNRLNAELVKPRSSFGQIPLDEGKNGEAAAPIDPATFVGGFGSHHPSGINAAFGDSHVVLLSTNISETLLQQLGHRSDGKLLDMDDRY